MLTLFLQKKISSINRLNERSARQLAIDDLPWRSPKRIDVFLLPSHALETAWWMMIQTEQKGKSTSEIQVWNTFLTNQKWTLSRYNQLHRHTTYGRLVLFLGTWWNMCSAPVSLLDHFLPPLRISPADLVDSNIHWMVAQYLPNDLRSSLMGNQNHKSQILGKHYFPPLKLLLSKKHTV